MVKKCFSRTIATFLSIVLLLGMLPTGALAADMEQGTVAPQSEESVSVAVTVVDEENNPLEGASIVWTILEDDVDEDEDMITDENGQIVLEGLLTDETYEFRIELAGYAPLECEITADDKTVADGVTVALTKLETASLTIKVTNGTDPIPGATVTLNLIADGVNVLEENSSLTAVTGSDGGCVFANVLKSLVRDLSVSATGYGSQDKITADFTVTNMVTLSKNRYDVFVDCNEGGTVTLLDQDEIIIEPENGKVSVAHGDAITLKVEANKDYSISTITGAEDVSGLTAYTCSMSITQPQTISVAFQKDVQEYTFWVYGNGQIGSLEGKNFVALKTPVPGLKVTQDEQFTGRYIVELEPAENFRVETLKINQETPADFQAENGKGFAVEYDPKSQGTRYDVGIGLNQFALNVTVAPEDTENTVDCAETVSYARGALLTMKPMEGYYLQSLKVNGVDVTSGVSYSGEKPSYMLEKVKADQEILATFAQIETAEKADSIRVTAQESISTPAEAEKEDYEVIYLYNSSDAYVTIAPVATGAMISTQPDSGFVDKLQLSATDTIDTVYILNADRTITKAEANVLVVKDIVKPGLSISSVKREEPFLLFFTKKSVEYTAIAEDKGSGTEIPSGIRDVVYSKNNSVTEVDIRNYLKNQKNNPKDLKSMKLEKDQYTLEIKDDQKSTYYFWAIDMAGNISSNSLEKVNIDNTSPVINSFSYISGVKCLDGNNYVLGSGITFQAECTDQSQDELEVTLSIGDSWSKVMERQGNSRYTLTVTPEEITQAYGTDKVTPDTISISADDQQKNEPATAQLTKAGSEDGEEIAEVLIFECASPNATTSQVTADYTQNVDGQSKLWFNNNHVNENNEKQDIVFTVTVTDTDSGLMMAGGEKLKTEITGFPKNSECKVTTQSVEYYQVETTTEDEEGNTSTTYTDGERVVKAVVQIAVCGTDDQLADFALYLSVQDNVGNVKNYNVLNFSIDAIKPTVQKIDLGEDATLISLDGNRLTEDTNESDYAFYFQKDTPVKVYANDNGSGVKEIVFFTRAITEGKLGDPSALSIAVADSEGTASFSVPANFKGQIYAYAIDNVGNSSESTPTSPTAQTIIETQESHNSEQHITYSIPDDLKVVLEKDGENITYRQDGDAFYLTTMTYNEEGEFVVKEGFEDGVPVTVEITDTFNGLDEISYSITSDLEENAEVGTISAKMLQQGKLYEDSNGNQWVIQETERNLITKIVGTIYIRANSNNVVLDITMKDNSQNVSHTNENQEPEIRMHIDNVEPKITISHFDNSQKNDGSDYMGRGSETGDQALSALGNTPHYIGHDSASGENAAEYPIYDAGVMQIQITERNLDVASIQEMIASGESESVWVHNLLAGSKDVDIKDITATLKGVYGPFLDVEDPDNGKKVRTELKDGDVYTDEVYYLIELEDCKEVASGGTYESFFHITDLTGHKAEAKENFVIDTTAPSISIAFNNNDVRNGRYYKADRQATITVVERNFDPETIATITGTATHDGKAINFPGENATWHTASDDVTHTATITFNTDGEYEFDVSATDLANHSNQAEVDPFVVDKTNPEILITGVEDQSANNGVISPSISYTDVNLDLSTLVITLTGVNRGVADYPATRSTILHGQNYLYDDFAHEKLVDDIYTLYVYVMDMAGNQMMQTIRFSCNRFGSVFDLSNFWDMLGKYNQQERDLILTETNVDPIDLTKVRITLTKNGTPTDLIAGRDFSVEQLGGDGSWSQYTYNIPADLFMDDGTYSLYIYTLDAAGNVNENIDESKDAQISFGIDKTTPIVTPIDFESKTQYAVESKTVSVEIKDNLLLADVEIYLGDQQIPYTVDGDLYTFEIPMKNSKQTVTIVAIDSAGNEEVVYVEDFLVTTNLFVRWYNNTPLFIGSVVLLLAVLVVLCWQLYLLFFKKRSKEEA